MATVMRGGPPRLCSVVGQHRISTLQTMDGQLAKQNAAASLIGRTDEDRGRARFGTMYICK